MESDAVPSRTALTAAAARAAHLIVDDGPVIFADTLAATLLGTAADEFLSYHRNFGTHPVLAGARAEVVCRSQFTEQCLTRSAIKQYVILGAGLDTYAYRAAPAGDVIVFEVDHPSSQRWKRQALAAAGIAVPSTVRFVPVNFETDSLISTLATAGFESGRPAFISCLGLTMYLSRAALDAMLRAFGALAPGTQVVADYMVPDLLRDAAGRAYADAVGPVVADSGEPWLSFYAPDELTGILTGCGFSRIDQYRQADLVEKSAWNRTDALRPMDLSHVLHATV